MVPCESTTEEVSFVCHVAPDGLHFTIQCHFAPITLCLPFKILHRHCSQFFLGITVVPRKIEENASLKKWGVNKVYYGHCENSEFSTCPETGTPI